MNMMRDLPGWKRGLVSFSRLFGERGGMDDLISRMQLQYACFPAGGGVWWCWETVRCRLILRPEEGV